MSSLAQAASRAISGPADGIRAVGRLLRKVALITLAAVLLAGAYLAWVRDLPIFAISQVEVSGTDDGVIISTLHAVARDMTTLHVDQARIDEVAGRFPVIASIEAEPDFPRGMAIEVEIRRPVAIAELAAKTLPVAADGTLLPGVRVEGRVPTLPAEANGPVLSGESADQVRVVGAAPAPLLELIDSVDTRRETGIAVELRGGVEVRFGTSSAAPQKWASAAAVLADDTFTGMAYVDVSAPDRPAVGGAAGGTSEPVEVEVTPVVPETAVDAAVTDPAAAGEAEVIAPEAEATAAAPEIAVTDPETAVSTAAPTP